MANQPGSDTLASTAPPAPEQETDQATEQTEQGPTVSATRNGYQLIISGSGFDQGEAVVVLVEKPRESQAATNVTATAGAFTLYDRADPADELTISVRRADGSLVASE